MLSSTHISGSQKLLTVFGITQTPTLNLASAIVNAIIAVALGVYAWGRYGRQSA
jgi:hypothetical protein